MIICIKDRALVCPVLWNMYLCFLISSSFNAYMLPRLLFYYTFFIFGDTVDRRISSLRYSVKQDFVFNIF